jgi:predicted DCC family thiol-disulfide oxidoreductase YuxK
VRESARKVGAAFDSPASPDTIVVVRNPGTPAEQIYLRSNAAATLLAELPQQWLFLGGICRLIPPLPRPWLPLHRAHPLSHLGPL